MNLVSIGGLFTLLGIAWLLSYHKSSIKLKPIFWGLGLQFLFALIILRQDKFSFLGMIILGLLLVTYIMQKDDKFLGGGVKSMIIMSIGSILTGVVLYYIPVATYWVMIAALIYIAVNSIFQLHQPSQRFAGAIFVISGIAYLMTNDLYGRVIFKSFSDSVASFLSLSDYGAQFLFGNLANGAHFFPGPDAMWPGFRCVNAIMRATASVAT